MEERKLLKKKKISQDEGNHLLYAQTSQKLGRHYMELEKHSKALNEFKDECKAYQKIGMQIESAIAYRMMGEMCMLQNDYVSALKYVNIYLKTSQKLDDKIEEQRAYATLGRIYLLQGQTASDESPVQLKAAEKSFIKSLLICKNLQGQIGNTEFADMQARLYLNIGLVKELTDKQDECISNLEKSIRICQSHDLFDLLHQCYTTTGLFYSSKLNANSNALRMFNLALDVAERLENKKQKLCESLLAKGDVLIKMGDFQSTKKILLKAYKMKTPDANDRQLIEEKLKIIAAICYTEDKLIVCSSDDYSTRKKLYEEMGDGSCALKNYSKGISYYLKMLENSLLNKDPQKDLIPIYVSLYQTYKDNKEYELALQYMWKEYEISKDDPEEAFGTYLTIGGVMELADKSFWDIQDVYEKARREAQKINNQKMEIQVVQKILKLQRKHGMDNMAEMLENEIVLTGIHLKDLVEEVDVENTEEENTPDIGKDICLSDLSDSASEDEERELEASRKTRKRGTALTVKRNVKGETQLHLACISGNLQVATRLIEQGHAVNVRDHAGWLPLHESCIYGHRDIVELLLDNGASINDKGGTSCDGITPLYDACINGNLDVIKLLLDRGANSNIQNDLGEIPLTVLERWYEAAQLNDEENELYNNILHRLQKNIDKVGATTNDSAMINTSMGSSKLSQSLNASGGSSKSLRSHRGSNCTPDERTPSAIITKYSVASDDSDNEESSAVVRKPVLREHNETSSRAAKSASYEKRARDDYVNTMASLRRRNLNTYQSPETKSTPKRLAHLCPNEVDDEWLDDDLGPNKKKTKYLTESIYNVGSNGIQSTPKSSTSTNANSNPRYSKSPLADSCGLDDDNSVDAFDIIMNADSKTTNKKNNYIIKSRNSFTSTFGKTKQQSSLLNAGFQRYRSESPPIQINANTDSTSTDYEVSSKHTPKNLSQTSSSFTTPHSVKVKVEDQLLMVPIISNMIQDLTIGWLADETSRRYYNLKGVRPLLRLKTMDGAIFEDTDPISLVLNTEEHVNSTVLEWALTPLIQKYRDLCSQMKYDIDNNFDSCLELAEMTGKLTISNQLSNCNGLKIFFKCLNYQEKLSVIDVSNNFLEDEGLKVLAKTLPTLKQLKELNLSGNLITATGIKYLLPSAENNADPEIYLQELTDLNLSFNPLGDQSVRCLTELCNKLPNLNVLNLSSCEFENLVDSNFNYCKLRKFDISFNYLYVKSFKHILKQLNYCVIEELNLGYCLQMPLACDLNLGNDFVSFFEAGTCSKLTYLNLSNLNLTDNDVGVISNSLQKCEQLRVINLMSNPALTAQSLKYAIQQLRKVKELNFLSCKDILLTLTEIKNIVSNNNTDNPETIYVSLTDAHVPDQMALVKEFWYNLWKEFGKTEFKNRYVKMYVSEDICLNRN